VNEQNKSQIKRTKNDGNEMITFERGFNKNKEER
jgi:hypothetical protein